MLSGSFVVEGSLAYVATAVGADSYAERIAGVARAFRHPRSPLELGLNRLLTVLVVSMVPLGLVLAAALLARESDSAAGDGLRPRSPALVILVPEGLMLLASLTAAAAAVKMARRGALVQQLNGVESLASVDAMCLDKTGTLTRADLRVERRRRDAGRRGARPCARTSPRSPPPPVTATARWRPCTRPSRRRLPAVVANVPFSSGRRWSAVERAGGTLLLGAPELFDLGPLADAVRDATASGRRVVAVASGPPGLEQPEAGAPPPATRGRAGSPCSPSGSATTRARPSGTSATRASTS